MSAVGLASYVLSLKDEEMQLKQKITFGLKHFSFGEKNCIE